MARRELSLRAVLGGVAIGALLAAGNVYLLLKSGYADTGSVTAALLGYALLSRAPGGYSTLENNITQTIAAAAALVAWFRDARPALIPQMTSLPWRIAGLSGTALALGIAWQPMLMAAGTLAGARNGVSVLLGAIVAWGGAAPLLARRGIAARDDYGAMVTWLLWPGISLMLAATLVSLIATAPVALRALADLRRGGRPRLDR